MIKNVLSTKLQNLNEKPRLCSTFIVSLQPKEQQHEMRFALF